MWAGWVGPRAGHPYLEGDWWMELYASQVNSVSDVFTFTAPAAPTQLTADIKADMKNIKVVPNPYYGNPYGENDPYNRRVQFTNLPDKCTIKIYDLVGNLIEKIEKDDSTTPFATWDLKNFSDKPVASGIFIYHIDAGKLGEKIGKIALFAPSE